MFEWNLQMTKARLQGVRGRLESRIERCGVMVSFVVEARNESTGRAFMLYCDMLYAVCLEQDILIRVLYHV